MEKMLPTHHIYIYIYIVIALFIEQEWDFASNSNVLFYFSSPIKPPKKIKLYLFLFQCLFKHHFFKDKLL